MQREELFRRMRKSKFFIIGTIMLLILVITFVIGPLLTPWDPAKPNLRARHIEPEWFANGFEGHILGTDAIGRDIFSRLVNGGTLSLALALICVAITAVFGTLLGLISGFFGGKVDTIIMRICEVMLSLPQTILCICIMALLGARVSNLVLVTSLTGWVQYCRLARGTVLAIRNSEYVMASRVLGAKNFNIIIHQVLPNVFTPLLIIASQSIGSCVLNEASLSYLGCGIPVTTPSWGGMISAGREYVTTAPWTVIVPGLALMFTVLAFNLLGDGVRDVLDPHNKD